MSACNRCMGASLHGCLLMHDDKKSWGSSSWRYACSKGKVLLWWDIWPAHGPLCTAACAQVRKHNIQPLPLCCKIRGSWWAPTSSQACTAQHNTTQQRHTSVGLPSQCCGCRLPTFGGIANTLTCAVAYMCIRWPAAGPLQQHKLLCCC